jgi:DNA-binding CsgD family transcriptional regulator
MKFRHALTRDALLAQLPPDPRAARARRALDALRVARPELDGDLAEVAAELAVTADDRSAAAALLLEVGRRALHQGALTSAESALQRARTYAAGSTLDLEVSELLVETLGLVGRVDEAFPEGEALLARLTDAARTADPDGHRRTDVHLALARAAVACTDWPLAASHLERAGEFIAAAPDLMRTARIDTMRAVVALGQGRLDEAEKLAPAAGDSAERTGVADLRCEALLVHGRCARMHNLDTAERSFDRARTVAREAGLAHREARALTELGFIDAWRDGGSARLLEARDLAAACGAPETEAVAENALAAAAWFCGDTDALQTHATAALALSRRFRLGVLVPSALVLLAGAHALRGDAAAMEAMLAEAAPLVADEPTQLIARHAHCLAVCALAHDDLMTARAEFAAAAAIVRDRPTATVPPLAVMHVLVGAVEGADPESLVTDFGRMRDLDVPLMAALIQAAKAVNLGRAGHGTEATAGIEHALRDLRRNSFVQAAVVRIVAPCAAADGWGDPAGWLTTALATFEARGLAAPARACRDQLRELGAPAAGRARSGDGLSGREREVLRLVAEGLANKTIAQRLFLSPRTVEKHVERLLAKTGSTNRAQLVTYAVNHSPSS